MRFGVLGPLVVEGPEGSVAVGGPKERALLAALVLRANAVVTTSQLVSDLWGEDPPRSAAKTVQTYVSHVRRALVDAVIETAGAGYRLVVDADSVDALRFEGLVAEGRAALRGGDAHHAARTLETALALWRGDPLAEFDEAAFASGEATRLNELRLAAIEDRVEAGLALGEARQLVGELQRLVRAHPLRERLWGQLMLALYRSGRQADALAAYQQARRHLVEEIGVEPGEELRALERALLEQDPSLGGAAPSRASSVSDGDTITVTVLLTDIEASTRLWETQPEAMAQTVADLERVVGEVVTAHHGNPVKTRGEGDSTFSVFARATDAVRASLVFQQAVGRLPKVGDEGVRVRAAVHTGEVQARGGDYYGRAINRAARLRSLAPGGAVLLSGATAALIADDLPEGATLVDLGAHELRDLARLEHVYALAHPDLAPPPELGGGPTRVTVPWALLAACERPMVGRSRELDRISAAWQRARAGTLGLALISGEPGIGKTRLAAELASVVADEGGHVLLGRCDEEALTPYQPFVEAIEHYVKHVGAGGMRTFVGRDELAALADLVPSLRSTGDATGAIDSYALFQAVTAVLGAATEHAPLLLVIDDLHWADRSTLALLRHVTRARHDVPLLLVATYRDTEVGRDRPLAGELADLLRDANVDRVSLRGLDISSVTGVLDQFETDASGLASQVCELTAGNPFFVAEIARHMQEAGSASLDVPEGVKDVIGRRLSRLTEDANRLLAAASVSGRHFELSTAASVVDLDDSRAVDAVEEALAAGLVREATPDEFEFSHALVRDTLYGELSGSRRTRFHRVTAECIEAAHADALAPVAAVLAYHYGESGECASDGPTARYSLLAADHASGVFAFAEAAGHASRALELAEAAGDELRAAEAQTVMGAIQIIGGDSPSAKEHLRRAIAAAQRLGQPKLLTRAVLAYGAWADELPAFELEVVELIEEALVALEPGDDVDRVKLLARLAVGQFALSIHPGRAAMTARDAIEQARRLGDAEALTWALGCGRMILGPPGVDADELAEVTRRAGASGFPGGELIALHWAAVCRADVGDVAGAIAYVRDLSARDTSRMSGAAGETVFEATEAASSGRFGDARRLTRAAEAAITESGSPQPWRVPGIIRYLISLFEGTLAQTVPILEPLAGVEPPLFHVREMLMLARCAADRDDEARATLDLLVAEHFESIRYEWWREFSVGLAARTAAHVGHLEAARQLYEILLPRSGRIVGVMGFCGCVGAVDHHLGILASTLLRFDDAVAHLESALAVHSRNQWHALIAESTVELGHAVVGRAQSGDRARGLDLIESGLAAATELGMAGLVARARMARAEADRLPLPPPCRGKRQLVGRGDTLDRMLRALAAAGDARTLVLLAGEPGIGKSELLAAFGREAHARGAAVLYGTCDEESFVAYQPFVEALRHLLARDRVAPPAADVDVIVSPQRARTAEGSEPDRWFVFEAVSDLLAATATRQPVLLLLDDLHWADAPTLALLRHLVSRGEGPMVVVGAYRDTDVDRTHPFAATLAEVARLPRVERLALGALSPADTAVLAGSEPLGERVHDLTAGNPFFVREVLRHFEESGDSAAPPQGVRDVIGRRVSRLAGRADDVLGAAAVIGREFDAGLVAAVTGIDEAAVGEVIDAAVRGRLVVETPTGPPVFAHALVRETLYREHSTTRRVTLHRAVAEALQQRHATGAVVPAAALAHHFGEAAAAGCAEQAFTYAVAAAEQAAAQLAYEEAISHYTASLAALDLLPADPRRRVDVLLALGKQHFLAGQGREGRRAFEAAADIASAAGDAVGLADAALGFAWLWYGTGEYEVRIVEQALAVLDPGEHPVLHARLLGAKGRKLLTDRSRLMALTPRALAAARATGDSRALHDALSCEIGVRCPFDPVDDRVALAEEMRELAEGDSLRCYDAYLLRYLLAVEAGDASDIDAHAARLEALGRERRLTFAAHAALAAQVARAMRTGEFIHASSLIDEAEAAGRPALGRLATVISGLQRWALAWLTGDRAAAITIGRSAIQMFPVHEASLPRGVLAMLLTQEGEIDEARQVFATVATEGFSNTQGIVDLLASWSALAEAALEVGTLDEVEELYGELRPYAGRFGLSMYAAICFGAVDHYLGGLARRLGEHDQAVAHLENAVVLNRDRFRSPVFGVRSEVELAATLAERGAGDDRARARELLEPALATAKATGMAPTAERASLLLVGMD